MMRADVTMLGVAALLLAAGTSPEMTPEQRREMLARTTGTIVGTIREAGTNQPLEGVSVSAQHLGDQTDANGRFRIYYIDPGEVEVTARRRDLIETRGRVRVLAAREAPIELFIRRSPAPCCRLAGTWSVRLVLREPGQLPIPRGTKVVGAIIFTADTPDPFPNDTYARPPPTQRSMSLEPTTSTSARSSAKTSHAPLRTPSFPDAQDRTS